MTDNPYWDEVRGLITNDRLWGGPVVEQYTSTKGLVANRHDLVGRYAWTITDPDTVAFVAAHAGPKVLDPMAGSGYWAHLLGSGIDVLAFDLNPPDAGANHWHKQGVTHAPVTAGDAVETAALYGQDRTLLLAWPPYDDPIGVNVVRAYAGNRILYIGEVGGGCCGDDALFDEFRNSWTEAAEHRPVQWAGMHDYVTIYDRNPGICPWNSPTPLSRRTPPSPAGSSSSTAASAATSTSPPARTSWLATSRARTAPTAATRVASTRASKPTCHARTANGSATPTAGSGILRTSFRASKRTNARTRTTKPRRQHGDRGTFVRRAGVEPATHA